LCNWLTVYGADWLDREWANLCCAKQFCATWLIVYGPLYRSHQAQPGRQCIPICCAISCVAQNLLFGLSNSWRQVRTPFHGFRENDSPWHMVKLTRDVLKATCDYAELEVLTAVATNNSFWDITSARTAPLAACCMLVSCFTYSSTLKMEAICSFET
jgi:hypothetical protein